jgi:hypothetical protein
MTARRAARVALLAAIAGTLVFAAGSPGESEEPRQTAKLTLNKKKANKATGVVLDIDYVNPDDAAAKPRSVRKVVTRLAPGARYDGSVPDPCTASDAQLTVSGESACPPASKVGEGVVTVDTGVPGPGRFVVADIDFLSNENELIYVNTVRGSGARTVIRAKVSRREIATDVSMLPGTPPEGGSIDTAHVELRRLVEGSGAQRRAFIRTPGRCPRRTRQWINSVTFTYADGVTQNVPSPSPCKPKRKRRAG